jgi:hypothetical protein
MGTIEQSVKAQFAKVFAVTDWPLFKKMAETNLEEAAKLKKTDIPIDGVLRLLARNSRKRLLIGVGVELLLKAVYLKQGYAINRPQTGHVLKFPFLAQDAAGVRLVDDKTFMLHDLISHLPGVLPLSEKVVTIRGLSIAKVFRNKEGHTVTDLHLFDATNYRDIASALVALYRDAFAQTLSVTFSVVRNERAVWRLSPSNSPLEGTTSCKPVSAAHVERRASEANAEAMRCDRSVSPIPAAERPNVR